MEEKDNILFKLILNYDREGLIQFINSLEQIVNEIKASYDQKEIILKALAAAGFEDTQEHRNLSEDAQENWDEICSIVNLIERAKSALSIFKDAE